jgi:hypothetical protein
MCEAREERTMHIHYRWDDEQKTLLLLSLEDGWTWVEYHDVAREITGMIRELGYMVDLIVDNSAKIPFPSGSALSHLREITRLIPDNLATIVLVGSNPVIKTINQILFRLVPTVAEITFMVDTREEAYAVIAQRRAKRGNHVG